MTLLDDYAPNIDEQIDAIGCLPVGWRYGEGVLIPKDVQVRAKKLAALGERQGYCVYASPGIEGEVILYFNREEYALEVYVKTDQTYDVYLLNDNRNSLPLKTM